MALASLGVIGVGVADGTNILTIPVTTSVPRSDPAAGASIVLVYLFAADAFCTAAADDAPTDSFYSTHLYTDGLNPWGPNPTAFHGIPWIKGLILNPLVGGVNTITLTLNTPSTFDFAYAFAYTGAQVNNQPFPVAQVPDQSTDVWFEGLSVTSPGYGPFGKITSDPDTGFPNWFWDWSWFAESPESLSIGDPLTTYPNWLITQGSIALISTLGGRDSGTPPGDFIPVDGTWNQIENNTDFSDGTGHTLSANFFEKPLSPPEANNDLGGTWTTATSLAWFGNSGQGFAIMGGLGPIWLPPIPPPPGAGAPVFDAMIRAA